MTRIIFQWMLIFIIGGILLYVSGESTVPTTADGKTPNSVTPLILSTTENRSSEISSSSVASKTNEEPEKLASTASNIELDEASKTPEPLNGDKSHNLLNSEVVSTEVLTTLFSTDPTSEDSEHGSSTELQEMTSTSKGYVISDKEYEIKIDVLDVKDAADKSLLSPANEIHETSTNIVGTTNEIRYKKDSFSTMRSEEKLSPHTEYSMSPSSLPSFTSESSPTGDALVEGSTPSGGQTTEVKNTEEYPEKQLPNHVDNVHLSEEKTAEPTLAVSESTRHLETETVEMTEITDRMESEDKSTENLLSLHQTTPKSATKKRSLNNTGDIILHRETTAASDAFSSSFQPELTTILEHGDSTVSGSGDEMIIFIKSNTTEKESNVQNTNESSAEALSPIATPSISSGFGSIENVEEREKYVIPHSNPEKTNENYSTLSVKAQDNLSEKETSGVEMGTGSVSPTLHSEASVIVPKTSDDYSHLNNLDNVDNAFSGVTFDPDGMKNSEPQDPDSVVFFVPSTKFDKTSTPENTYSSTTFTVSGSSESEREFKFVTHKNLNEGGDSGNETGESEKMVHIPLDKNINVPPQLSHNPVESAEIENFGTANNSNSSSNFVFWDPSNGGWILPKTTTDTQIKRIDTGLNDESEEMLQDAPQFFDHKSPSSNLKTDPKEKDEIKSTVGDRTSSFSKELETETVTEAGFIGFSNSFVPHQTDQSVIRPVKIKLTSPDDKSVSTSVLPESFSTLEPEQPTGLKLSEPIAGPAIEKIETSSTNTSSPKILPDSTPSVITEIVKSPELSTIVIQPELVPFSLDKKSPEATGTSNTTSTANSTIAGIAVKTSVSVSLPLSKSKNDSQALQPLIEELMKKLNSSSLLVNGSTISLKPETSEPSSPSPSDSSTDGLTITSDQTTTETGFKIRKPKIKIPGGPDSNTPRPYRPFTPGLKRPTTTAGPPISIFRKQKTRIASITSSTTARPYRPFNGNFATVKIQFASDIPGLLPQEFLISTEPVTTTTTEPTTTEEPISEVPFTDQTHIPTVANEDDVTLVKVAGYIEIDRGLRWNELLDNRHSPEYKKNAEAMHLYLERMFRSSPIASRLWKIKIDGFSNNNKKMRPVGVDFFLYLIKTRENIPTKHLAMVFHEKLSSNNTFGTFRVDPSKTTFEMLQEEPLKPPTPPPEEENVEPPIPQWAIAVIVIGAASLIFIVLFAAVTIYGRHHMRRRYSSKLNEEDMERSSGEWESKMAAAYENMAADTIYDAEDLHSDSYKKSNRIATFHGIPSTLKRCDSWSSNGWTTPPKRKRPHVH